jgi:3-hydroxyisobutyrate dehydrogenase
MGGGMAANLLKGGADLVVFDPNPAAVAALCQKGARKAGSVAELASGVDVLFTSLPGPAQVEEVMFGPHGVVAHMRDGLVLFELSTSAQALAVRLDEAFKARGGAVMDAPVSGGPAGAASGDLALWIGGERAVFDRHLDLLKTMADKATYVGPIGTGTVTKLAHNLLGYMIMQSLAEVFSLAVKAGVDALDLWEALRLGAVGKASPLNLLTSQFLPGKYDTPAFAQKLAHKDVMLATGLARDLGVPMRIAGLTLAEMSEALGRGWGENDSRSFLKLQLERAGVAIAVEQARIDKALQAAKPGPAHPSPGLSRSNV